LLYIIIIYAYYVYADLHLHLMVHIIYYINDLQLLVNKRFTIYALFCMRTYIEQCAYNRKRIK